MHAPLGIQAGAGGGFGRQPGLDGGAVFEVHHQQAADHGAAVPGQQRPGEGDALRGLCQVGLVLRANALAQFGRAFPVQQVQCEEHGSLGVGAAQAPR